MSLTPPPAPPYRPSADRYFPENNAVSAMLSLPFGILGALGVGAAYLLPHVKLPFGACSFYTATKLPCPGCGLTRSVSGIFRGEFALAWAYNPFGFAFAAIFALLTLGLLLPRRLKNALIDRPLFTDKAFALAIGTLMLLMIVHGSWRLWDEHRRLDERPWWMKRSGTPVQVSGAGDTTPNDGAEK